MPIDPAMKLKEGEIVSGSNSPAFFSPPSRLQSSFLVAQSTLRALSAASSLVALSVMVMGKEFVPVFGIRVEAPYNYSSAFRFLLGVDSVECGFSILSLVFICHLSRIESNFRDYFFLFLHNLAIMVLMISGCSAAGMEKRKHGGWQSATRYLSSATEHSLLLFFGTLPSSATLLSPSSLPRNYLFSQRQTCKNQPKPGLDQQEKNIYK